MRLPWRRTSQLAGHVLIRHTRRAHFTPAPHSCNRQLTSCTRPHIRRVAHPRMRAGLLLLAIAALLVAGEPCAVRFMPAAAPSRPQCGAAGRVPPTAHACSPLAAFTSLAAVSMRDRELQRPGGDVQGYPLLPPPAPCGSCLFGGTRSCCSTAFRPWPALVIRTCSNRTSLA